MAELAAQPQVYTSPGSFQVWRTLLNWVFCLFTVFRRLFKGAGSCGRIFHCFSIRNSLIWPSSFKPLPSDAIQDDVALQPPDSAAESLEKLIVVLDLDETLVCAYETSSLSANIRSQATQAGIKWFELECVSIDKEGDGNPKVNHVTVFERPGLHEFLIETSEFAELVLFTAGLEGYARPLVDRIDPEKKISQRLYRPETISTKYREHVKDLSCLSQDLCRIVIVDNNPFSFLLQPLNGIPCVPFSAGQPEDEQLLQVLLPMLKELAFQRDVRPYLHEKFRMPEWFQKHGIPSSAWLT